MSNRRKALRTLPPQQIVCMWVTCNAPYFDDGPERCEGPPAVVLVHPDGGVPPLLLCVDHYEDSFGVVPHTVPLHDGWLLERK